MSRRDESLSSDDSSAHSDYESAESALAAPLSPRLDSEDDMEPLVLGNADLGNPNAPAPAHPGQTLMQRLAMRVQVAAAGGPQDAGGPNSPQLDPVRQQQVDLMQQPGPQQVQQLHELQLQQRAQQMQLLQQRARLQLQQRAQQMQARQAQEEHEQHEEPQQAAEGTAYRFSCKFCPERFTHVNLLTRHTNEEHPVTKPYVCPDCGRGYVIRETMEAHYLMVHRNERPYPCDQCDKVFSRREYLVTHSRVHTGFKPYLCGDCGRRFAWKGSIDIHRRTHTGERPYLCITCSRDFAALSTLKMHEMIHTNSFPHPCTLPGCDRKFRRGYDLRMHAAFHEREDQDDGEADNSRTEDEVAVAVLNQLQQEQ